MLSYWSRGRNPAIADSQWVDWYWYCWTDSINRSAIVLKISERSVDSVVVSTYELKYPEVSAISPVAGYSFIKRQVKINFTLIGFFCFIIGLITLSFMLIRKFLGSKPFCPFILYVFRYPSRADCCCFGLNLSNLLKLLWTCSFTLSRYSLQNFWVAKALMSSFVLCKMLSFFQYFQFWI